MPGLTEASGPHSLEDTEENGDVRSCSLYHKAGATRTYERIHLSQSFTCLAKNEVQTFQAIY